MNKKEYREKNLKQVLINELKEKITEMQSKIRFKAFSEINLLEDIKNNISVKDLEEKR